MTPAPDSIPVGTARPATLPPHVRFELTRAEPAGRELQRIAIEQVDLILWHVQRVSLGDEHVHGVRKATKRVRSVLRMIRDEVGEAAYRRDNATFRDSARELSALRTATVALDILKGLATWRPELATSAVALHARLAAQTDRIRAAMFTESWLVEDLVAQVERGRMSIESWELPPDLVPTTHGLQHTYRHGQRAMGKAYALGTEDRFHDWRKRVKYLRHQIEILAPIQRAPLPITTGDIAELGEGLGLEHDLADLEATAVSTPAAFPDPVEHRALLDAITERRRMLQTDLRPLAERVYAHKPGEFVRQMTTAWERWNLEGD